MDAIDNIMHIPTINATTNFWMVRTKRGFFFNEFLSKEYIAIGWNLVTHAKLKDGLTKAQEKRLKAQIKEEYGEAVPGNALNKCVRFCNDVKAGDIAVIVDSGRIAFAEIGEYYEESSPELTIALEKEINEKIEKTTPRADSFECPYVKRRKISVIKVLKGDSFISPYLQTAMARNWHSLSSLNDYAELILSACYDAFIYGGKLTATFRITQSDDINAIDLSSFMLYAARILSSDSPELVSVKTALHSPGDIILQIGNFLRENPLSLLVCYFAVFGGRFKDYEFPSLLGIVKGILNAGYEKKKKALELRKLEAETKVVEQEAIGKELENLKRKHELEVELMDQYAEPLAIAADKLQVLPPDSKIIDFSKLLETHSKD